MHLCVCVCVCDKETEGDEASGLRQRVLLREFSSRQSSSSKRKTCITPDSHLDFPRYRHKYTKTHPLTAAPQPSSSCLWTSSYIQLFTRYSFPLTLRMAQTLYVLPAGIAHKKGKTLLPGDEPGNTEVSGDHGISI